MSNNTTSTVETLQAAVDSARKTLNEKSGEYRLARERSEQAELSYERDASDANKAAFDAAAALSYNALIARTQAEEDLAEVELSLHAAVTAEEQAKKVAKPVQTEGTSPVKPKPARQAKQAEKPATSGNPKGKAKQAEKPAVKPATPEKQAKAATPPLQVLQNEFTATLPKGYEILFRDVERDDGTGGLSKTRYFYFRLATRNKVYRFPNSVDCSDDTGMYRCSKVTGYLANTREYDKAKKWILQFVAYDKKDGTLQEKPARPAKKPAPVKPAVATQADKKAPVKPAVKQAKKPAVATQAEKQAEPATV